MLKQLCCLLSLACVATVAYAQFAMGAKAGYSVMLRTHTTTESDLVMVSVSGLPAHGFHGGLTMRIGRIFYAQPEVYYSILRQYNTSTDTAMGRYRDTYSTVEVPMLFGAKIAHSRNFNLHLVIGPKFRFPAGAVTQLEDLKKFHVEVSKWQLGFAFGLGFDVDRFFFDMRYNVAQGLFKVSRMEDGGRTLFMRRGARQNLEFSLGFLFIDKQ